MLKVKKKIFLYIIFMLDIDITPYYLLPTIHTTTTMHFSLSYAYAHILPAQPN